MYLAEKWMPNPTLADFEFLKCNSIAKLQLDWDTFDIARNFYGDSGIPSKTAPLFDQISPFFEKLADAGKSLQGRIAVEAFLGDFVGITKNLHHSTLDRPEGYPKVYDRLHLSNTPGKVPL